jgi:hypothetical protein
MSSQAVGVDEIQDIIVEQETTKKEMNNASSQREPASFSPC